MAARHPEVVATAPFVVGQGLLTNGPKVHGAFVRGILPEQEERVADIGKHMKHGSLDASNPASSESSLDASWPPRSAPCRETGSCWWRRRDR